MKKVKISDVARAAGVSTTTVSRVVNRVGTVRSANRRQVEEAIRRLGYRPNVSAQRLAGGRSGTVGLILPRFEDMFRSYYAMEVLGGVGEGAEPQRLDVLLHLLAPATEDRFASRLFSPGSVDGVLFADLNGDDAVLRRIIEDGVPCVVMNAVLETPQVSCVAVDNAQGARDVVQYLLGLGHRRIATVTGDPQVQSAQRRLEGYREGLAAAQLPVRPEYVVDGAFRRRVAAQAMQRLLGLPEPPTAVFIASDEMALEALDVAREVGVRVPEELSLVGFDDTPLAAAAPVPLTTVAQPLRAMGREAVALLVQLVNKEQTFPTRVLLETRLVVRASCAPPKS